MKYMQKTTPRTKMNTNARTDISMFNNSFPFFPPSSVLSSSLLKVPFVTNDELEVVCFFIAAISKVKIFCAVASLTF